MNEKITLIKDTGEKMEVEFLTAFQLQAAQITKIYTILTANELDPNGMIRLFISEVIGKRLEKIADENEWTNIKNAMRSIISSSPGNYTYVSIPSELGCGQDFNRIIAVKDTARDQLKNDYLAHKPAPYVEKVEVPKPEPSIYPEAEPLTGGKEVAPGIIVEQPTVPQETPVVPEQPVAEPTPVINPIPDQIVQTTPVVPEQPVAEPTPVINPIPDQIVQTTPVVPEQPVVEPTPVVAPEPVIEQPIVETPALEKTPKEVLMEKISAAVDEYLETMNHIK